MGLRGRTVNEPGVREPSVESPYLCAPGAAVCLRISARALENFRTHRGGPAYRKRTAVSMPSSKLGNISMPAEQTGHEIPYADHGRGRARVGGRADRRNGVPFGAAPRLERPRKRAGRVYRIEFRAVRAGDFAFVEPTDGVRALIEERGYLPPDTSLIKRVAALSGAQICREQTRILIDGVIVARALLTNSQGRPTSEWSGCFTLRSDQVFLLNDHQKFVDGRYFGAMTREDVIDSAAPIWTFAGDGKSAD